MDGTSGRAAVAFLDQLITTEVAEVVFQERPEYALSTTCGVEADGESQLSEEFQVEARLVLSDSLEGVKVQAYGKDFSQEVSWHQFCHRSTEEAELIWVVLGREPIRLLRAAYRWPRAKWFQPVAIRAAKLLCTAQSVQ
jgi:hypothetical protein